jgi:lysophospholipase L1-like esterase
MLPVVWLFHPLRWQLGPAHLTMACDWKRVAVLVALLVARYVLRRWLFPRPWGLLDTGFAKKITFALATLYLFVGGVEGVLRMRDFRVDMPPIIFKDKDARGGQVIAHTVPDPELLWRLEPGSSFQGRPINQLGFRDREVNPVKAPGTHRVLCLGDSVTAQGLPGYPQYLHEKLQAAPPTPEPWEALNLGMHGYSSLQGLRLLQRMAPRLAPDVVTVYFGWNDHWLSKQSDCSAMALRMNIWSGKIFQLLQHKRCVQFLAWTLNPTLRGMRAHTGLVYRVPPDDYRATLFEFVKAIRAAGAVPVLITAPRRHLEEGLVAKHYAHTVAQAEQDHDKYVAIVREVARARNVIVCDLAAQFAGRECDGYFSPDGIHMDLYREESGIQQLVPPERQPGLMHIAEALQRTLQDVVRSKEWKELPHPSGGAR